MDRRRIAAVSLAVAVALFAAAAARAATLPPNFSDDAVVSVPAPTALAFTPDGRMLVTTQGGALDVVLGTTSSVALDLSSKLCSNSERGLLGVAVDPAFPTNHFVYLYYTFKKNGVCDGTAVNRVSRFTLADTGVVSPGSETILLDNIPSPAGNHNGGGLGFGKDNLLYVSVGDGGCDYASNSGCAGANDAARDRNVLLGKVLRITRDGAIPRGNPFTRRAAVDCRLGSGPPGTTCRETYAWGLRNPFRFAFDPNAADTRFFINDVGQDTWEEIDLGQKAADYGWNAREGHCANASTTNCGAAPAGMTNPIFDYSHAGGCDSITGGAFVPNGVWPGYDGAYLYSDYICGAIFRLDPNGSGGYTSSTFASSLGGSSAVDLRFGPFGASQALYYTTYAGGGEVRRISYQSAGVAPPSGSTLLGFYSLNPSDFIYQAQKPHATRGLTVDWDPRANYGETWSDTVRKAESGGWSLQATWSTDRYSAAAGRPVEAISPGDLARGAGDEVILHAASELRAATRPVLMRFESEMNISSHGYSSVNQDGSSRGTDHSAAQFIAAWRRVRTIFRGGSVAIVNAALAALGQPPLPAWAIGTVGAPNVAFAWVPNTSADPVVPGMNTSTALEYYPGDAYVDWIGLDFYDYLPNNTDWSYASGVLDQQYTAHPSKPFGFFELGLLSGTDDAQFVNDVFNWVETHPRVGLMQWWDATFGTKSSRLAQNPAAAAAYRNRILASRYLSSWP